MKILMLTLLLLLVISVPVMAENKWNESDTALIVLRVLDWAQTRDIATRYAEPSTTSDGSVFAFYEINPILGRHPTVEQVNAYFLSLIGTDIIIAKCASPSIKKWWKIIGITIESYLITSNIQLGVQFKL